jgi:hypothetical protein
VQHILRLSLAGVTQPTPRIVQLIVVLHKRGELLKPLVDAELEVPAEKRSIDMDFIRLDDWVERSGRRRRIRIRRIAGHAGTRPDLTWGLERSVV